ncbi:MAG: zinc ABC transporter substrate-binding protein [Bacteroidales bacterium]|nr:zinc ABC transporter substrate-binding protein [Bacteroidales bacterium]
MKNFLLNLFAFILIIFLFSCKSGQEKSQKQSLTVSILPQKYIAEQITGTRFQINVLLPVGANHETFEPRPSDMASLSGSSLYFSVGSLDFERNWIPRIAGSVKSLKIINTSIGIPLLGGHHHESHEHEGSNSTESGIDPHTWLSPEAVKVQARNIAAAVSELDAANAKEYELNLERFTNRIDSLQIEIKQILKGCKGKTIMLFHPSLAYFAREFDLEQLSIEEEGKEPSAGRIRELIDIAKLKGVKSILISKEFDVRHAETIAAEIGGKIVVFDPMSADWPGNLVYLANAIAKN